MVNKPEKEFLQELKQACDMAASVGGLISPEWLSDLCESRIAKIEAAEHPLHSDVAICPTCQLELDSQRICPKCWSWYPATPVS